MNAFFNKKKENFGGIGDAIAIDWAKSDSGKFFNLIALRAEDLAPLQDMGGVFIVWYSGLKTVPIYIGATDNLIATLKEAQNNPQITAFHEKGGLGVTWATIADKYRNRITTYLRAVMKPTILSIPEFENTFAEEDPFAVIPPFNT